MAMGKMDEESKAYFASVLPVDMRIQTKPMFGNLGSFINGNMFAGLFQQTVFARLPESDRIMLMEKEGAAEFSPMPGKPMKEYIAFPPSWRSEPDKARMWMDKALAWVEQMPLKEAKPKAKKK